MCVCVSKTQILHPLFDCDEDLVATVTVKQQEEVKTLCFLNWTQTVKLAIFLCLAVLCFHWWACSLEGFRRYSMLIVWDVCMWWKWKSHWTGGASLHAKSILVPLLELQILLSSFALLSHSVVTDSPACPLCLWCWAGWEGPATSAHGPFSSSHSVSCH